MFVRGQAIPFLELLARSAGLALAVPVGRGWQTLPGELTAEVGGAGLAQWAGYLEMRPRFPRPFRGMNKRPPSAAS
jgi:hypothetical protein